MATNERKTDGPAIEASAEYNKLTLAFSNGQRIQLDIDQLNPSVIQAATLHGLKQKLVDAAAISRDPETGRAATIETKYAAVCEVYNRLLAGEWNKRREGGGTSMSGGLLARALFRMYDGKKTQEELAEFLSTKSDKEKAALRKNPRVAMVIDQIRAENAPGDTAIGDQLLGELED